MASTRVRVSNPWRSAPWSGTQDEPIATKRSASHSARAPEGASGPHHDARAARPAKLARANPGPGSSTGARAHGAQLVSRRAFLGASRPYASTRRGRRQDLALARAQGNDDPIGS